MVGCLPRVYAQYRRQPDDLAKNVFLANMRDRNEVLFYRLLAEHLEEMLPIVYTPTVGRAIERYSHEYRRPRGVFLSANHPEHVEESLRNYGVNGEDVDLLVATDSEGIVDRPIIMPLYNPTSRQSHETSSGGPTGGHSWPPEARSRPSITAARPTPLPKPTTPWSSPDSASL